MLDTTDQNDEGNKVNILDFFTRCEECLGARKITKCESQKNIEDEYTLQMRLFVGEVWQRLRHRLGMMYLVINGTPTTITIEEAVQYRDIIHAKRTKKGQHIAEQFFSLYMGHVRNCVRTLIFTQTHDQPLVQSFVNTQKILSEKITSSPRGEHPFVWDAVLGGIGHAIHVCSIFATAGLRDPTFPRQNTTMNWLNLVNTIKPAIIRQSQTHSIVDLWLNNLLKAGGKITVPNQEKVILQLPPSINWQDHQAVKKALCDTAREGTPTPDQLENLLRKGRYGCPATIVPRGKIATKELVDKVFNDFTTYQEQMGYFADTNSDQE
jgi:hypothetical protein